MQRIGASQIYNTAKYLVKTLWGKLAFFSKELTLTIYKFLTSPKTKAVVRNSTAPVLTLEFLIKGFILAVLSSLVVGIVSVGASISVTQVIYSQPIPTVKQRIGPVNPEDGNIPDQKIVVNKSDWTRYSNSDYGFDFLHPKEYTIEEQENRDSGTFMVNYQDSTGQMTKLIEIQAGNYSGILSYLQEESNSEEFENLKVEGKKRSFNTQKFREGAPAAFDNEGKPLCFESEGTDTHFSEVDKYLISLTTSFHTSDCNDSNKELTVKTGPIELETGRQILGTLNLKGYNPYKNWRTLESRILGLEIKYPTEMVAEQGSGERFLSPDYVSVPQTTILGTKVTIHFIQAPPSQSFLFPGLSAAKEDQEFGIFKLFGKQTKLKVRSSGEVNPVNDQCPFSGDLTKIYYAPIRPGIYGYFILHSQEECMATATELETRLRKQARSMKQTIVGVFQNLSKIKPTKQFNPFSDSQKYVSNEYSFLHPSDWTRKVERPEAGWPNKVVLSKGNATLSVFVDQGVGPGLGVSRYSSEPVNYLWNQQKIKGTELWNGECEYLTEENPALLDQCYDVESIEFLQHPLNFIWTAITLPGTGISVQARNGEKLPIQLTLYYEHDPSKFMSLDEWDEYIELRNEAEDIVSTFQDLK